MRRFFNFSKPDITTLDYISLVVDGKACFLISWQSVNLYRLVIPELKFSSYKLNGSAYIAVPDGTDTITLSFRGFWRKEERTVALQRIVADDQLRIEALPHFDSFRVARTSLGRFNLRFPAFKLRSEPVKLTGLNCIQSIKNLDYKHE